ncbi:unnamed protein product [Leuciscus chuanchicus]
MVIATRHLQASSNYIRSVSHQRLQVKANSPSPLIAACETAVITLVAEVFAAFQPLSGSTEIDRVRQPEIELKLKPPQKSTFNQECSTSHQITGIFSSYRPHPKDSCYKWRKFSSRHHFMQTSPKSEDVRACNGWVSEFMGRKLNPSVQVVVLGI